MNQTRSGPPAPRLKDPTDLAAQARRLRRRLDFWRRMVWLLLGAVGVFAAIIWQREQVHRRECRQALEYYSRRAAESKLAEQHRDVLELQWQHFQQGRVKLSPVHYDLIVSHWRRTLQAGESLPLAVCRDSHLAIFSHGRHALIRDETGDHVVWMAENQAKSIAAQALKDNRLP